MAFSASYISYKDTNNFSSIVIDYLEGNKKLRPFYDHSPTREGIKKAIAGRAKDKTNRTLLVDRLKAQYADITTSDQVKTNIEILLQENTFTVTTAHQPNIFTGHLYFIYKILHVIKLAEELKTVHEKACFVPVFYMGSEDADLEELGEIQINGKKYQWNTKQKGAVGKMKVDNAFIRLLDEISGQISVEPFGVDILDIMKKSYFPGRTIEQATLDLLNELFGQYGLVVFLPGDTDLKREFSHVIKKELTEKFSGRVVAETIASFPQKYKVQATGRDINLFYLKDDIRERIEPSGEGFVIANTSISFSYAEMIKELEVHPERFSPNVILRPVFQECILPNIAFVGGGGELAYWLELKKVFEEAAVPFPVLVLRNSFMVVNNKVGDMITKLGFTPADMFRPENELVKEIIHKNTKVKLSLHKEQKSIRSGYNRLAKRAYAADVTLQQHVEALTTIAIKKITELEKKMLRAEKKKFEAELRQLTKIKAILFPGGSLQERVDNIFPYYATWGAGFIDIVYQHSKGMKQKFCILEDKRTR